MQSGKINDDTVGQNYKLISRFNDYDHVCVWNNTRPRCWMDIVVTTTIRIKFERPLLLTICVYYTERKSVQVSYKLFSKLTSPSGDVGSIIVDEVNLENCFTCAQCRGTHAFRNYLTRHNQFSFHSTIRYLLSTPF